MTCVPKDESTIGEHDMPVKGQYPQLCIKRNMVMGAAQNYIPDLVDTCKVVIPIYIYIHIHTHIHTYIQTDRQTDRHTYIHTYTHTYIYTYICIIYIYVHAYISGLTIQVGGKTISPNCVYDSVYEACHITLFASWLMKLASGA